MARTDFRAQADLELAEKLLAVREVKSAAEAAERDSAKTSARHQLLATSLRLMRGMAPRIDAVTDRCREILEVETELETFVFPSAVFNAACVRPERGRVFVLLASSLIEAFSEGELAFVIGHELGHHVLDHHRLPAQLALAEATPGPLALQLFAWQRYAEISADRAGLLCCRAFGSAAEALFKLASGLRGGLIDVNAGCLLDQVGDMRAELDRLHGRDGQPRSDWFATHPFSPLRLQAAKAFAESELFTPGGTGRAALEAGVVELMSIMEPGYLEDRSETAEYMRRLLFAGGVAVAAASGGIAGEELEQLERFFGEGSIPRRLDPDALRADLPRRMGDVRDNVPPLRRAQVVRDLCLVALADGRTDEAERQVLLDIASGIGVDRDLVVRTLAGERSLD